LMRNLVAFLGGVVLHLPHMAIFYVEQVMESHALSGSILAFKAYRRLHRLRLWLNGCACVSDAATLEALQNARRVKRQALPGEKLSQTISRQSRN